MTKFLEPSFSVHVGSKDYRSGWERIFSKKPANDNAEPPMVSLDLAGALRAIRANHGCVDACAGVHEAEDKGLARYIGDGWGGVYILTPEGAELLARLDAAD